MSYENWKDKIGTFEPYEDSGCLYCRLGNAAFVN